MKKCLLISGGEFCPLRKKEEFESQAHHGDVKAGGGSVEPPIEEPNLNVI